jgi:HK97 family phage major capsid protein
MFQNKRQMMKALRSAGVFDDNELKTLDGMKPAEARAWLESQGELKGITGPEVEALWAKKVTISIEADAGEEVDIIAPEAEPMPSETNADGEDDEDEPMPKMAKPQARRMPAKAAGVARASASFSSPTFSPAEKRYDRAIKDGVRINGRRPVFDSGEQASRFGAWTRLVLTNGRDYPQKARDLDIIGKAHVENDNALGGALVPDEFSANLIDTKNEFGAFRRACGVTPMSRETLIMPRIASDATVSWIGEASTQTAQSTPTFDNVQLVAKKAGAYFTVSNELINDAAVNVADAVAVSLGRAFGEFEDDAALLGENDTVGINDLIPPATASNAIFDAELTSAWSEYTTADIMAWLGKIPDAAWRKGNVSIVCSVNFYHSVLLSLAQSAGGNLPGNLLNGVGGRFRDSANAAADAFFDGIPIFFTSSAPTSYSADQGVAWAGAFDLGAKFGEVSGSNSIQSSEHAAFASDQLAIRALERVAINLHDIQDDANSMVITLKD